MQRYVFVAALLIAACRSAAPGPAPTRAAPVASASATAPPPAGSSALPLAMVKDGVTGRMLGTLAVTLVEEDAHVDGVAVAFCGTTARVALGTARELTVHTLPDGKVVARFPAPRGIAPVGGFACSADGHMLAVADGEDIRTIAVP